MSDEIKLTITGLVYNQSVAGTYGLVMSEVYGSRRFSVMIGEPEAQSIALKLNNKVSARPLTHDLIRNLLNALDAVLQKVLIYDMVNDVFYSELYVNRAGKTLVIDARTSDAVALAVRCDCPIYIKSDIMNVVGTEINIAAASEGDKEEDIRLDELDSGDLARFSSEELEKLLAKALEEEGYELAAVIRDMINKKAESSEF
ncbi:MAG: DUF151 domain-containing protein [Prevotellaceae bacterium]|jgi:bifunctional DNase/RNase|nr:DUF151 domain-containing protein [Prevotellaceae bacterium]